MKCSKARKMIHSYIDDALGADGRFAVDWHLEACPRCRKYLQEMAGVAERLGRLAPVKAPSVLHFMLKSRVRFSAPRPIPSWFSLGPFRMAGAGDAVPWRAVAAVVPITILLFVFCASLLYRPQVFVRAMAAARGGYYGLSSPEETLPSGFVALSLDHDRMVDLADTAYLDPRTDRLELTGRVNPTGNVEVTFLSLEPRDANRVKRILDSAVRSPAMLNGRKVGTLFVLSVEQVRAERL